MKAFVLFFNTGNDDAECFARTLHAGSVAELLNSLYIAYNLMGIGITGLSSDTYALELCDDHDLCALFDESHHDFIHKHKLGWAGVREVM